MPCLVQAAAKFLAVVLVCKLSCMCRALKSRAIPACSVSFVYKHAYPPIIGSAKPLIEKKVTHLAWPV